MLYLFDLSCNNNSPTPSAFIAFIESAYDSNWYLDLGATSHSTVDLKNLNFHSDYQGTETIKLGNGTGLRILHIGSFIKTPHKSLSLNKILLVPSITQNLLFVSQFTHDNNVYFEFYPNFFVVKDLQSGKEGLREPNKGGLYCLKHTNSQSCSSSSPPSFIGTSSSFDT